MNRRIKDEKLLFASSTTWHSASVTSLWISKAKEESEMIHRPTGSACRYPYTLHRVYIVGTLLSKANIQILGISSHTTPYQIAYKYSEKEGYHASLSHECHRPSHLLRALVNAPKVLDWSARFSHAHCRVLPSLKSRFTLLGIS